MAIKWSTSNFCESGGCVEIGVGPADGPGTVVTQPLKVTRDGDSYQVAAGATVLCYTKTEWAAFMKGVHARQWG